MTSLPFAGMIMGTRCGDIDPAIIAFIVGEKNLTLGEVMDILSMESGFKGICGQNDLRGIHRQCAAGEPRARLALDMLIYRYKLLLSSPSDEAAAGSGSCEGLVWDTLPG